MTIGYIVDSLEGAESETTVAKLQRLPLRHLAETWTEAKAEDSRALYVETTFDPEWIYEAQAAVADELRATNEK